MIQKLADKIKATHAPICVGLDPMLDYIPEHILKKALSAAKSVCVSLKTGFLLMRSGICNAIRRSVSLSITACRT